MFTEPQRQRFRALQQREDEETLTASEQVELQAFAQQIEAEEAVYLRPANERIRQERLQLAAQTAALKLLLQQREHLARRLEQVLALTRT